MAAADEATFQAWEKLIESGKSPYYAARKAGTTLSALQRGDRERKAQGMELARERLAAKVDERVDELVLGAEPPAALVIAWAKANHPESYVDKVRHEHTGKIEHEHRAVYSLGELLERARERGVEQQLVDGLEGALPAARALPAGSPEPAER